MIDFEWDPADLSKHYGMLYTITNGQKTVNKSSKPSTITIVREMNPRSSGRHIINILIDSIPSGAPGADGIGLGKDTFNWTSNALNSKNSICFNMSGQITMDGLQTTAHHPPLQSGDAITFDLDCDSRSLVIMLNGVEVHHQCNLFEPPYYLAACFRNVGYEITVNIENQKGRDNQIVVPAAGRSLIVSDLNLAHGEIVNRDSQQMGLYVIFRSLGPMYKIYFRPDELKYLLYFQSIEPNFIEGKHCLVADSRDISDDRYLYTSQAQLFQIILENMSEKPIVELPAVIAVSALRQVFQHILIY